MSTSWRSLAERFRSMRAGHRTKLAEQERVRAERGVVRGGAAKQVEADKPGTIPPYPG